MANESSITAPRQHSRSRGRSYHAGASIDKPD